MRALWKMRESLPDGRRPGKNAKQLRVHPMRPVQAGLPDRGDLDRTGKCIRLICSIEGIWQMTADGSWRCALGC